MISKVFRLVALFYFIIFVCSFINPLVFPPLFLNELLIIGAVISLPFLIVLTFFIDKLTGIIYVVLLLCFSPYYFSFISYDSAEESTNAIEVLSFNTSYFRAFSKSKEEYRSAEKKKNSQTMINWVANFKGDIMCFQEYFYDKNVPVFTTNNQFEAKGFSNYYISSSDEKAGFFNRSLAIFSKSPIVNQGEIFVDENLYNRGIFADIQLRGQTIRIINIHLHSNELKRHASIINILKRYIRSSVTRQKQVNAVCDVIEKTDFPIILCGDINQTVFSYAYKQLSTLLENTFEERGSGFGATFNSNKLFFLRIDQQFCSEAIKPLSYKVNREMALSDHFPITCKYVLD